MNIRRVCGLEDAVYRALVLASVNTLLLFTKGLFVDRDGTILTRLAI